MTICNKDLIIIRTKISNCFLYNRIVRYNRNNLSNETRLFCNDNSQKRNFKENFELENLVGLDEVFFDISYSRKHSSATIKL